jgi:uracil-DNA glycosylase family 4
VTNEEKILELVKGADPDNPIEYVDSIVRPYARKKLDELLLSCKDCPTCKLANVRSVSYGDDQAAVMIINEGIYESQLGQETIYPLQGTPEGELLDTLIDTYHINRRQLFWMNAVNCYTCIQAGGKSIERAPNSHEAEYCRAYLDRMIEIIHPVMIILLGNIPLNLFKRGDVIGKAHGKLMDVHGVAAMPTYSPHYLVEMRKDEAFADLIEIYEEEFCEDIKNAFKYVQENFEGNVVLEPLE